MRTPTARAIGSALAIKFVVRGAGKVVEGTMTVPDDDGTTHLPMMVHGLMKDLAESVPELCQAKSLIIETYLELHSNAPSGD